MSGSKQAVLRPAARATEKVTEAMKPVMEALARGEKVAATLPHLRRTRDVFVREFGARPSHPALQNLLERLDRMIETATVAHATEGAR